MKIKRVKIENFRSIENIELEFKDFNTLVGQNNHGKTNFFEAIDWFFNGFSRSITKPNLIFSDAALGSEILVEIEFIGLRSSISEMTNASKRTALKTIFEDEDSIIIRRTTSSDEGKKRELYNPKKAAWENVMGTDNAWNDLLPTVEYVHTKVSFDEVGAYKSKSPISEMLTGVLSAIIESDPKYLELKSKFSELFGNEDSEVRVKLNELGNKVQVYLLKQFPEEAAVKFNVEIPEFTDLLKKFSTEVNDGVSTSVEEKGDGMQRAVMLSIIQAYADYRKENEIDKKFIFMIDEAELHLHPTAQRALKKALLDISASNDQVFVNTHSSVLLTDRDETQMIFKVEKHNKRTLIMPVISDDQKMDVIFELLGGSPADLLLPRNFMIVEGRCEYEFLKIIKARHYPGEYDGIKIVFARGDMAKTAESYHAIHEAYKPLFVENGIYKNSTTILCDQPNEKNKPHYDLFISTHPWLEIDKQLHVLPVGALEKYYPEPYRKNDTEIAELDAKREKVSYAIHVASQITKEEFETNMTALYSALQNAKERSFN